MNLLSARVVLHMFMGLAFAAPWAVGDDTEAGTQAVVKGPDTEIVAYYFHGNVRCVTCRKIETYSEEAITSGFGAELLEDRLEWRVVNVDEAENEHFIQEFQLSTRSVVLAEYRDGTVSRWENLDKVWQLVRDKDRFVDYIQAETREFLGAS